MPIVRKGVVLSLALLAICFEAAPQEQKKPAQGSQPVAFNLIGSEWLLTDLAGTAVLDKVQATLAFPEAKRVTGNGSCNRFFGPAEITGSAIKLGPLGATRRACEKAVMDQEKKYLDALQAAERLEWKDPYLLIHAKGFEKPLSFTRQAVSKPAQGSQTGAFNLIGSEWLLTDLAGAAVVDKVQATLAFSEAKKVTGSGSCNRFFGPAEISGNTIKLGPLGATRMACEKAVMEQEKKYLDALQTAERFEWKDPYLLIYSKGLEKPLSFTRKAVSKPAPKK